MKGMQLFDNYEEDGQLSLFSADYDDWDEDWEETPEEIKADEAQQKLETEADAEVEVGEEMSTAKKAKGKANAVAKSKTPQGTDSGASEPKAGSIGAAVDSYEKAVAGLEITSAGPTVRVKYCASCGKLLFVREETAGFHSECNNCGIKYFQKL